MKIIDLLRLLRKHIILIVFIPSFLAVMVTYLTRKPSFVYSSETTLYTGIASGSSVDFDKSFSYFANNTAFDNLINVINSRETQKGVALKLLAQHLMLDNYDPKYISKESYIKLRNITPEYINKLIVKKIRNKSSNKFSNDTLSVNDTVLRADSFSFDKLDSASTVMMQPKSINKEAFEQTVKNLETYLKESDTNFVYKLLNFNHPHYSIKAISSITVQRIASSDLVKLKYNSNDPGICQQTLALMTEACIQNYKLIKERRSDAVVKYFEHQLRLAAARLKIGEDKLLKFNEDNNIINYYEQSKAVAVVKEDLDNDLNNKRIKLAGTKASIKRIEEKLGIQKQIQLKSSSILEKRNELSEISSKIATAEIVGSESGITDEQLVNLKVSAEKLKEEIKISVNDLYGFNNSVDGLPIRSLLNDWIENVIEYEDTKAGLDVLKDRIKEFQKQYAIYAPAGANIKRIEREISVSEQEFLEILHGLNLAKLKSQDAELSATIKAVDPPFFPLSPNPTKRKILILAAFIIGLLIVLSTILATEYFDDTLKNAVKANKILNLPIIGVFPKVFLKTGSLNFPFVTNRLLEMAIQQIELKILKTAKVNEPFTLLFLSTLSNEGKTVTAANIAWKLKNQGKKVLYLNFSRESLRQIETNQIGYPVDPKTISTSGFVKSGNGSHILSLILGYGDKRVNTSSPFLGDPDSNLDNKAYQQFHINPDYYTIGSYKDILENNNFLIGFTPDIVLIEIPPILYYTYPSKLIAAADLAILVCRSNRIWSAADQGALETLMKITAQEPVVLLNGVEIQVIESYLGDLPKKRNWLRRVVKNIIRFQFYSRHKP